MDQQHALLRALFAGSVALGLSGCGAGLAGFSNVMPNGTGSVAPDGRGVISYQTYQVAVGRDGDTLSDVAARVGGTSAAELGELNGLPRNYRLRQGEMIALPDTVPRAGVGVLGGPFATDARGGGTGWTPEVATSAIENAPSAVPVAPGSVANNPFGNGQSDLVIDPIRHRVEPGETAYSIARLYGVSVTALASWNGLGSDMSVRESQELLIPVVSGANQIQTGPAAVGEGSALPPPPSASQPLPPNIVAASDPASPDLAQYRTPSGGRLVRPVVGPITRDYNPGGSGEARSDGIAFSVPAGTPIQAAGAGEVALVSESLGGLGTIVLIRHADDLITVYGRVANVTVERGQQVTQGQPIGSVAPGDNPALHFEVRRGTQSVDPKTYIES